MGKSMISWGYTNCDDHNVGKVAAGTVFRKMVFEEAPAPPRPFLA